MARRREHKALYEVLGGSKLKPKYGKDLEKIQKPEKKKPPPPPPPPKKPQPVDKKEVTTGFPKKPKMLHATKNGIDIRMSYPLVIAALMGIGVLLLVAFRLGQLNTFSGQKSASDTGSQQSAAAGQLSQPVVEKEVTTQTFEPQPPETTPVSTGNNRIVIQQYHLRSQLQPVQDYFAQFGIETEILKVNNNYFLVTKNKYNNPNRQGTDGYEARQRIVEIGANYVAPEGYETFGKEPFNDAYGRRFDE